MKIRVRDTSVDGATVEDAVVTREKDFVVVSFYVFRIEIPIGAIMAVIGDEGHG